MKFIVNIMPVILLLLSALLFILPTPNFYLDVLQSFALHAMIGYGALSLLFLLLKKGWLTLASLGSLLLLLLFFYPYLMNQTTREFTIEEEPFKVAHFNVLRSNKKYELTIQKALNSKAHLLSFQEVDTAWAKQLKNGLSKDFPYYKIVAYDQSTRGLAVFSSYPLNNMQVYYWYGIPNIAGDVTVGNREIHFLASHTLSPINEERHFLRNQHIRQIGVYLRSVEGPVLAIGDYNIVPWNHQIIALKEKAQLLDSRKGFTSTYPAILRSGGIPIDYIFHSPELECISFRALPTEGSDHRGVLGTYQLKDG